MYPDLTLHWLMFSLSMSAYSAFMLLAFMVSVSGALIMAWKKRLPMLRVVTLILIATFAGIVGARALHFFTDHARYAANPWSVFEASFSGFSLFGGIVGATIAAWLMARSLKLEFWKLADLTAPFLGLGIMFLRIGCFLNGCCFGKETTEPWGIRFPFMSTPYKFQISQDPTSLFMVEAIHPTQLYELGAAAIGIAIAVVVMRKKWFEGAGMLSFVMWFAAFRLLNDQLRIPAPNFVAPSYMYPVLYLALIVMCAYVFKKKYWALVDSARV